jgi:Galactosyltransferase
MNWKFRRDLASELRLIREELKGLHGSVSQILSGQKFLAPNFVFVAPGSVSEEEVREKAESLVDEFGALYEAPLKQLHRYSEFFFLEYVRAKKAEQDASHYLKLAIQCEQKHTQFHDLLFRIYQRDFRNQHRESIEAFRDLYGTAELIILHLSCRARASLAKTSAATFIGPTLRAQNLIVVGHAAGKRGTYSLIADNDLLVVPANDAYEGLAEKSAAAYAFMAFAGSNACVLKVDDDIHCVDPERLVEDALPLVIARDYVGRVWHTQYYFCRSWHLGKCQDPELNTKPYGLLADASYAEGPDYLLGPRAVQVLGKAAVYLEQQFEVEGGYEDVAVGKVLNHYGLFPVNYDLIKNGILASTDPRMMERAGLPLLRVT